MSLLSFIDHIFSHPHYEVPTDVQTVDISAHIDDGFFGATHDAEVTRHGHEGVRDIFDLCSGLDHLGISAGPTIGLYKIASVNQLDEHEYILRFTNGTTLDLWNVSVNDMVHVQEGNIALGQLSSTLPNRGGYNRDDNGRY